MKNKLIEKNSNYKTKIFHSFKYNLVNLNKLE